MKAYTVVRPEGHRSIIQDFGDVEAREDFVAREDTRKTQPPVLPEVLVIATSAGPNCPRKPREIDNIVISSTL